LQLLNQFEVVRNALHWSRHIGVVTIIHSIVETLETADENLALPFLGGFQGVIVFVKQKCQLEGWCVNQAGITSSSGFTFTRDSSEDGVGEHRGTDGIKTNTGGCIRRWDALSGLFNVCGGVHQGG
jgi:hypothetical protein